VETSVGFIGSVITWSCFTSYFSTLPEINMFVDVSSELHCLHVDVDADQEYGTM